MVPSSIRVKIVDLDVIKTLEAAGVLVICCGGGGIPVVENDDGSLQGVEAVIDKDLASSVLASDLAAELLVISTAVPKVALNFNTPDEKWLDTVSLAEAREYLALGGAKGIVTSPENLDRALRG